MKFFRDVIALVLTALIILILFNVTLDTRIVYSQSMFPTIQPGERIIISKAAYLFQSPRRGEVIVFNNPRESSRLDLIKRIIAVPGDTVEIKEHTVFVNNTPLFEPYIQEPLRYAFPRQEITEDHYFVLGDNRNLSSDSHMGWTVPRRKIVGKAWIVYWPPQQWQTIKHYSKNAAKQINEPGTLDSEANI